MKMNLKPLRNALKAAANFFMTPTKIGKKFSITPLTKIIGLGLIPMMIVALMIGGVAWKGYVDRNGGATLSNLDKHVAFFTPGKTNTGTVRMVQYERATTIPFIGVLQWGSEEEWIANLPPAHYWEPFPLGPNTVAYKTDRNGGEEILQYNFTAGKEMTIEEFAVFLQGGGQP